MRYGAAYVLPVARHQAETAIDRLSQATPWINFGYAAELKDAWNLDRHGFVDQVDGRRTATSEAQAASNTAGPAAHSGNPIERQKDNAL